MLMRFVVFAAVQLAAAALGWWLASWPGALAGAAGGGLLWFLTDLSRGLRLIGWLRDAQESRAPEMFGLWGEAADRTRRLLRKQAQAVQDAELRLQQFLSAIQASSNGVLLLDAQGRIEWCNQMACDHFGIDAQRDLQQHIGHLVRDPAFTAYYASNDYLREVTMPGRSRTAGRPLRLSVRLHPYGDQRRLLLSRDVTALEQADAMRRDFVANVSHEIRTPLTVLSGFVETLQTLPLDEEERARYLALMATQAARMQGLVDDLLTLSRLEGSAPPGVGEWVKVHEMMVQCAQEARALSAVLHPAPATPQLLAFETPAALSLAGAATELRSAVSNLISNAIRYTPAGGRIQAQWTVLPDGSVEFAVTDTGPGIAPEHLPRLSERFYRVDRSRSRETGGTGLGLAISKHVMQRHGGELRISSTLGKGSRFALWFPAQRVRTEGSAVPALMAQDDAAS